MRPAQVDWNNQMECPRAKGALAVEKLKAWRARGANSEVFSMTAAATAHAVGHATRGGSLKSPNIHFCSERQHNYICMQRAIYVAPASIELFAYRLLLVLPAVRFENRPRHFCEPWKENALRLAGYPSKTPPVTSSNGKKLVVLLTRRSQSVWKNRAEVAAKLRKTIEGRGYAMHDAGEAEDLGNHDGCYRAYPQIDLWRRAWLVISPVGAHLSNVVFMQPGVSAGLLVSQNCNFNTSVYRTLAACCGVKYRAAEEFIDNDGHHCGPTLSFNERALNRRRHFYFSRDTLLQRLIAILDGKEGDWGYMKG